MKAGAIVSASLPSLTRPRLRTESERRLLECDQKSAACYADAEQLAERIRELARQFDAIPVEIPDWESTSTVTHVEELRQRTSTSQSPPIKR